jgi:hypothetical protein
MVYMVEMIDARDLNMAWGERRGRGTLGEWF